MNTPRTGCCSSGWLQCHPHWELPQAQCLCWAPALIPGDTGDTSPGPLELSATPETSWLLNKTLQTGNHQPYPTTAASQGAVPRDQGWSSRSPARPQQRCDGSLQLHYSPPIEKVIKNNLGITRLIGLQPSSRTHTVRETRLC